MLFSCSVIKFVMVHKKEPKHANWEIEHLQMKDVQVIISPVLKDNVVQTANILRYVWKNIFVKEKIYHNVIKSAAMNVN